MATGFNAIICTPLFAIPEVDRKAAGGIVTIVTWFVETVKGMGAKLLSAIETVPDVFTVEVIYRLMILALSSPLLLLAPVLWSI